ncbi:hypothetical protein DPMN_171557 [Dreissena polymorpha]|uniref:Uncharacterized protein n=1 Tax=Dreissena polymorpha TaxID=45954 RepID=A0A9D4DZD0_DREPO|nr:hypothetical protein DPMN_171557 [Dreissena polymorpha]
MARQRLTRLIMGPCIVEIDQVNRCRNEENAQGLVMGLCIVEIDRIVIRIVQYKFEVNRCRNEEIIVKGNFVLVLSYENRCRNEEVIVKGNFGWEWPMYVGCLWVGNGVMHIEIDRIVIREFQYQFEVNRCRNEKNIGTPGLVMRPCIVEIDGIVIREVQYQFEVNRCRNKEINFQGSSAYSVGGDSGQDGQTDGRRRSISPLFLQKTWG